MTAPAPDADDGVAAYKAVLREVLERRPSGMRQRLAEALGTTRSFVSQISNPAYATPIPAPYVGSIFEICHFSDGERKAFLTAYRRAHPRRGGIADGIPDPVRTLTLEVPDLGSPLRNAEFDAVARETVALLVRLAEQKDR